MGFNMPFCRKKVIPLITMALVAWQCSSVPSATAATPRSFAQSSIQNLSIHTDQLVKQVQTYLQTAGRWSPTPQGQDMQLCQALQNFQALVGRLRVDNSTQSVAKIQGEIQQLQVQAQQVNQLIIQVAQNPMVTSSWMQVGSDLSSLAQMLSSVPAGFGNSNYYDSEAGLNPAFSGGMINPGMGVFPGTMMPGTMMPGTMMPGAYYPGFRPTNINITENSTFDPNPTFQGSFSNFGTPLAPGMTPGMIPGSMSIMPGTMPISPGAAAHSSAAISDINAAETQTERFIKQVTGFLTVKGNWPPAPGSNEMQLCQNIQSFQIQLRKMRSDLQANVSYSMLQSEMQQIAASSQNIDRLLMQINATPDITARWNEVRTALNSAYSTFFSAGTGYMWMR